MFPSLSVEFVKIMPGFHHWKWLLIFQSIFFKVLEDLIVALKIVPPNSKSSSEPASASDENKENIQQTNDSTDSKTEAVPMDVETTEPSTQTTETVDMVSDVDCSISENDWSLTRHISSSDQILLGIFF